MSKLSDLKAARVKALADAKLITESAKAAHRDITADEETSISAHLASAKTLAGEITAEEQAQDRRRALTVEVEALAGAPQPRRTTNEPGAVAVTSNVRDLAANDENRGFKNPRDFFSAVMRVGQGRAIDPRLAPLAAVGSDEQRGDIDTAGGFLVPRGFSPNLLSVQSESDPTVGRTMAIPMDTPMLDIAARTDKNHTTSVVGGLTWSRRPQTGSGTDSKMDLEKVTLKANSLMGVNYQTEELLRDSPTSVAALIGAGFQGQYAAHILNEKLFGTGAGEFMGVMNAPATISQAKETGQAAATLVLANILKMRSRCWGYGNAIWLANHDTYPQLAQLTMNVGTGGIAVYTSSVVEDRPDMLLGRPIFYTEYAQTLGTTGDLILGNWSQYLEGTLQGMEMQESIHVRFIQNERTFRATVRNDGQPWWRSALTPKRSSVTLSPFVALATRA